MEVAKKRASGHIVTYPCFPTHLLTPIRRQLLTAHLPSSFNCTINTAWRQSRTKIWLKMRSRAPSENPKSGVNAESYFYDIGVSTKNESDYFSLEQFRADLWVDIKKEVPKKSADPLENWAGRIQSSSGKRACYSNSEASGSEDQSSGFFPASRKRVLSWVG